MPVAVIITTVGLMTESRLTAQHFRKSLSCPNSTVSLQNAETVELNEALNTVGNEIHL